MDEKTHIYFGQIVLKFYLYVPVPLTITYVQYVICDGHTKMFLDG
jgi:hypothetical protein